MKLTRRKFIERSLVSVAGAAFGFERGAGGVYPAIVEAVAEKKSSDPAYASLDKKELPKYIDQQLTDKWFKAGVVGVSTAVGVGAANALYNIVKRSTPSQDEP